MLFAILDDMGKGVGLNIWLRTNADKVKVYPEPPDFYISNVNIKKALLNFLRPMVAHVFPIVRQRSVWLYVAVELSEKETKAMRALIGSKKLTLKDATLLEDKTTDEILKYLSLQKLIN